MVPNPPNAEPVANVLGLEVAPKADPPKALDVGVAPKPPKAIFIGVKLDLSLLDFKI